MKLVSTDGVLTFYIISVSAVCLPGKRTLITPKSREDEVYYNTGRGTLLRLGIPLCQDSCSTCISTLS